MKLLRSSLAAVAVLFGVFSSSRYPVANAEVGKIMMNKAAEEFVATPVQEAWKDLYEALVRKKGGRMLRKVKYQVSYLLTGFPGLISVICGKYMRNLR